MGLLQAYEQRIKGEENLLNKHCKPNYHSKEDVGSQVEVAINEEEEDVMAKGVEVVDSTLRKMTIAVKVKA